MAKVNASENRAKHIDISCHLVGKFVHKEKTAIRYCPMSEMSADILRKPVDKIFLERFRKSIKLSK